MGVMDFIKSLKIREWVNIGFFVVSLAILITGSVLMAEAISMMNNMPPFPEFPTCPTITQPKAVFTTSVTNGITWSNDLNDPTSTTFKTAATSLQANISKAWSSSYDNSIVINLAAVSPPLATQINAFSQTPNGVNFYTEFIFADASVSTSDVNAALASQGFPTDAYTSSTSQCSGLIPQSGPTSPTQNPASINPSSQSPTSIPVTSGPVQNGAYCDASQHVLSNMFLVDISVPIIGTLDEKLAKISSYLNSASLTINLPQTGAWNNQEFILVIYGGNEPVPMGRARNQVQWNTVVSMLNSTIVNPTNADGHNMEKALRFVLDNYPPVKGTATNIIIVADGFNLNEVNSAQTIANVLKTQNYYSIGSILMSTSQVLQSVVLPITSDFYHFYPIDSVDYLQNVAVQQSQAQWACQAFYPTQAPPTPMPTRIPLQLTTNTATTGNPRTTPNPLLPAIAACKLNVLFLIDQSQTMLLNGYDIAVQYSIKMATSLHTYNSQSTFAFIVYNQAVVSKSTNYTNYADFVASINQAQKMLGTSDPAVGFTAAQNFIKANSQFNDDSTRSLLFFVTDGNSVSGNSDSTISVTKTIRATYLTQVIGIDLVETVQTRTNIQNVIQYNIHDGYAQSAYTGVPTPNNILDNQVMNSTINQLICKDTSQCNIDLTFAIETSEAEGDNYVDIQVRSVLNVLSNYAGVISPLKMSVSLIYFSSPDNLVPNQPGNYGTLFQQQTSATQAINILNTTSFAPYGGASDLQLGFQLTAKSLQSAFIQNNRFVVFFARGAYEQFSNCCPDPTADAATVRSLATVQGVTIGQYSNKQQLDTLTGSNSIDANAIIGTTILNSTDSRAKIASQISGALIPIIDNYIGSQYCPTVPDFVNPPCEEPIDTLILLHANDQNNWNSITDFTANQLIPALLGTTGNLANRSLTTSVPINFAIASYYYLDVNVHADFTYLRSPQDYVSLVKSLQFIPTKGTASLSLAYKRAITLFMDGRPFASKNIILLTDTMDISDMEDANSEHGALTQLVGGYTSALTINTNTIPGADFQMNVDPLELSRSNQYAERQLANALTTHTCNYVPVQFQTQPVVSPTPTLPGAIPVVKARNIWPDITILIDTSVPVDANSEGMTAMAFEKIRTFLGIYLNQYSVGEKSSRFTIATFDGNVVDYSCKFIETNNYYDLNSCRNEKLSFYSRAHTSNRDIARALADVGRNVYGSKSSGYRALNENFLIVLTLGKSSTYLNNELINIERMGVRTIALGLSDTLSKNDLSIYGQNAYLINDWNSVTSGIDVNYDLADRLVQKTTKKRIPSSSNFFANLVFIVDQSQSTADDHANVVQFVSDFVTPFLLDDHKTQVSIVPFASNVISPLSLTETQSDLDNYLGLWRTSVAASSTSNIGNAIKYVANILPITLDRPTYVIYLVGASNTTGTELSKQLLSKAELLVVNFNLGALSYSTDLVYSASNIYTVSSSDQLLNRVISLDTYEKNPIVDFTTAIFAEQESKDTVLFPLGAIAADVVILLDETGLTDSDFSTMKTFLSSFTSKFHVGPTSTQFALQAYNGRTIPHDGFHFSESTSGQVVRNNINQLTLAKATENSTDADLAGAIEQELYFFLTEENGWRDDTTTYTIIFSHADSFYERDTSVAQTVKNSTTVFAVGTNGQRFDYVRNFTNGYNFYETVASVSEISLTSPAIQDLMTAITNNYRTIIYPTPLPIKNVINADFIFLVDNALGNANTDLVQNFLFDFTFNVGYFSISGNDTKMAVVNYGSSGVGSSWTLGDPQDITSLRNRIANFEITTSTGASNLRSAIDSIILNENDFGVNPNRPTYLIVIAGTQFIQPSIDTRTSRQLNTRYSTFVIQTNDDKDEYPYVPQVLGTQLITDRIVYDQNLKLSDPQFSTLTSWISSEYSAWATTYPSTVSDY